MKRRYGVLAITGLAIAFWGMPQNADAVVSGVCSACHTMHDSQSDATMATDGPNGHLLLTDCDGCHTTTGTDPRGDSNDYPYVKSSVAMSNYLAGGYFTTGGDADGHDNNSHTLGSNAAPAGYDGTDENSTGGKMVYTGVANGLGCAGSAGCHGDGSVLDEMEAVSGGHHGTSTGGAYRILTVGSDPVIGAAGTSNGSPTNDYEEALNAGGDDTTYHNRYSATPASGASISELCAKCHSDFHGATDTFGSAWIRHPTDQIIPAAWEIRTDFDNKWVNNEAAWKNHPLGFSGATETEATAYVTCLSCHRAHGSANDDILRWDYATQVAGSAVTYGCLGCHNGQRGS